MFPRSQAPEVLRHVRDFLAGAPREVCGGVLCTHAPLAPFVPPELQGAPVVTVLAAYWGTVDEGAKALAPLKQLTPAVDLMGPTTYLDYQAITDANPPGRRKYWRSELLPDDVMVVASLARLGTQPPRPGRHHRHPAKPPDRPRGCRATPEADHRGRHGGHVCPAAGRPDHRGDRRTPRLQGPPPRPPRRQPSPTTDGVAPSPGTVRRRPATPPTRHPVQVSAGPPSSASPATQPTTSRTARRHHLHSPQSEAHHRLAARYSGTGRGEAAWPPEVHTIAG